MSWFQTSANETEAAKEHVCMFIAVEMGFSTTTQRFWTGIGNLVIGGNTFIGTGELGKISMAPDNTRLVAEQKTYQLSGVDLALVSESDLENCYGRSVVEYFGFLTADGSLRATPEINWEGRMEKARRVDGAEPMIQILANHRLSIIDKADGWRYTHEHQQQFYAGDYGFEFAPMVLNAQILWGGTIVTTSTNGGNNGRSANLP